MALPVEPHDPAEAPLDPDEEIIELAVGLPVPEGFRVEVIDGRIIVTRPPDGDHAVSLEEISDALRAAGAKARGLRVLQSIGLCLRPGRKGLAIPDLVLVDEDFRDHPLPHDCYPPGVFHLVVEVTSSNWRDDLESKAVAYATVGVPHYLVVDREHRKVVVFSRPHDGAYRGTVGYLPGEEAEIPGPVPCAVPVDALLGR